MGKRDVRLGSTVRLDEEKDKDVIETIDNLSDTRKLGEFLVRLIRIYSANEKGFETREALAKQVADIKAIGVEPKRAEFFESVSKEMNDMKKKVDTVYDMCLDIYTMNKFGKAIGLVERTDNLLMSNFLIERQFKELVEVLGVNDVNTMFTSNKIVNTKDRADKSLEYIINSYSGIVNELKSNLIVEKYETAVIEKEKPVSTIEVEGKLENITVDQVEDAGDDEVIDFGGADFDALTMFMG